MLNGITLLNTAPYTKRQQLNKQNVFNYTQIPFDRCDFSKKPETKVSFRGNNLVDKITQITSQDKKGLDKLKLGEEINRGVEATVCDIKGHPGWVARVKRGYDFFPKNLEFVTSEENPILIAQTKSGGCQILKKIQGKPLFGPYWNIFEMPNAKQYLEQLKEFEKIPNEAFVKYIKEVHELRQEGFEIDTINPNNILYDAKSKQFNILDTKKSKKLNSTITLEDFYPFVDGKRVGKLYKNMDSETKKEIAESVRKFFDRIIEIGKSENLDLKMEEIDHNKLQNFLVYLYYNDETMLKHY